MKLFRKKPDNGLDPCPGVLDDLERLWRRARALPLAAPLLLLVGLGAGRATNDALVTPSAESLREPTSSVARVHLEALTEHLSALRNDGTRTEDFLTIYRDQVQPVEKVLRNRGLPSDRARRIAWPLVQQSTQRNLPIETVISVMLIESGGKPTATSPVGARGLMQVMPFWSGTVRGCGRDLYDIETNLCNGTHILAYYYKRFGGDERRALLGYNGCVRGTNTPNCHTYPDKMMRVRNQIANELRIARRPAVGRAAAP